MNFIRRGIAVACMGLWLVSGGCRGSSQTSPSANGLDRVVLMLNWFPEAEHGGFYAAQVQGIYEKYGLEVEIRPGGPQAPVAQELVAGRIQFAVGNADDVLLFREQAVPVVALLAPIQNTPRCILVHESSEVRSLRELNGLTLQAGTGRPFLDFMKAEGLLEGVQVVPYSGVAKFVTDTDSAMQAYSFSEPLLADQQGAPTRALMLSDIGFNPYASCLLATENTIAEQPDLVRRMVAACHEGWRAYFENPGQTNAEILNNNQHGMTVKALEFGARELEPLCITDEVPIDQIGMMSASRWDTLVEQFADLELVDPERVRSAAVFDNNFLQTALETSSNAATAE